MDISERNDVIDRCFIEVLPECLMVSVIDDFICVDMNDLSTR